MKIKTLTVGSVVQFKKDGVTLEGTVFCFRKSDSKNEVGVLCGNKFYLMPETHVLLKYVYVSNHYLDTECHEVIV